jgi:hypothetical protein
MNTERLKWASQKAFSLMINARTSKRTRQKRMDQWLLFEHALDAKIAQAKSKQFETCEWREREDYESKRDY